MGGAAVVNIRTPRTALESRFGGWSRRPKWPRSYRGLLLCVCAPIYASLSSPAMPPADSPLNAVCPTLACCVCPRSHTAPTLTGPSARRQRRRLHGPGPADPRRGGALQGCRGFRVCALGVDGGECAACFVLYSCVRDAYSCTWPPASDRI